MTIRRELHLRGELRAGALAGVAGGAAMAVVLLVAGEGPLQRAIDLEAAGGEEVVSRAGQRVGGVVAALLVGLALGVAFAVTVSLIRRRAHGQPDGGWRTSMRVAALAFVALQVVPLLKYPANPPGVGETETVGRRTALYLLLLVWSLFSLWAGWRARRWLAGREVPAHLAQPAAACTVLGLVVLAFVILPAGPNPDAVPASVVWSFRLSSLVGWAAFWAVMGTVFGWLRLPAPARWRLRRPAVVDRVSTPD